MSKFVTKSLKCDIWRENHFYKHVLVWQLIHSLVDSVENFTSWEIKNCQSFIIFINYIYVYFISLNNLRYLVYNLFYTVLIYIILRDRSQTMWTTKGGGGVSKMSTPCPQGEWVHQWFVNVECIQGCHWQMKKPRIQWKINVSRVKNRIFLIF